MKKIKYNWKKILKMKGIALIITTTTLTACGKEAECNIVEPHAHKYLSSDGYMMYIEDEHLNYKDFNRQNDYITFNENEREYYDFIKENKLMSISDNLEVINNYEDMNHNYLEYEYKTHSMRKVGKIWTRTTHYHWTTDPNHSSLTGEQRILHYVYTACKIEQNSDGEYYLVESDKVNSIEKVMDEYPFIKPDYWDTIVIATGKDLDTKYEQLVQKYYNRIIANKEKTYSLK